MVEILNIASAKGIKYNHTQNSYKKMMCRNQGSRPFVGKCGIKLTCVRE